MQSLRMKIELCFISLSVLFLLLVIKTVDIPIYWGPDMAFVGWKYLLINNIFTILFLILFIVSLVMKARFGKSLQGATCISSKIHNVKNLNYNYLMFFTTYIIPLICFDVQETRDCVLLLVLLIILCTLFLKTNVYYQNPILALMGLNLYEVDMTYKSESICNVIVIADGKLKENMEISKHNIDGNEVVYCKTNNR